LCFFVRYACCGYTLSLLMQPGTSYSPLHCGAAPFMVQRAAWSPPQSHLHNNY
jgi:hypothetical protein